MINLWQTQWHGINFREIETSLSSRNLPSVDFYSAFYKEFNERYKDIGDLSPEWVSLKKNAAALIMNILKRHDGQPVVLSLGAGIGLIEGEILTTLDADLYVQEISEDPFRFYLDDILDSKNKLVGVFPDVVPDKMLFDFVILGGIDYLFTDEELKGFLEFVKQKLGPNGKCILVSWSLYQSSFSVELKNRLKILVSLLGGDVLGQLWGYLRTDGEIDSISAACGMKPLETIESDDVNAWRTTIKVMSIT